MKYRMMRLGRLISISLGLALLIAGYAALLLFLSREYSHISMLWWFLAFVAGVFGLVVTAVYQMKVTRLKRIVARIEENGLDTGASSRGSTSLEQLEQTVEQWGEKQHQLIQELESREEFRREYMGNVSHELKTPIFNIQGYILTLLDGAKDNPEVAEKFLKRASKSVDRMTSLIKDMDALSRVESGQYDIVLEPVQIKLILDDAVQSIESYARKHNAEVRVAYRVDEKLQVLCDASRIIQVLDNLLVNAIKYSDNKKEVVLTVDSIDSKVQITVKDNGFGIPEKEIGRIFERFYRVDKARSRDAGGSGLGLSIVKHIIDKHNESISVQSVEGKGTEFKFTLQKV